MPCKIRHVERCYAFAMQAKLAGGCIMFSARPSVCSSVRPLSNSWTQCCENERTDFDANWHKLSTEQEREVMNDEGHEVKGQGPTWPK